MRTALLLSTALALPALGCCQTMPNWWHPGPAALQQSRAQATDPYPDVDAGPEIVGARPRDFDRPRAEARSIQSDPRRMPAWGTVR